MFSRFIFDIVFDIRVFRGHHFAICFLLVLYVVFLIILCIQGKYPLAFLLFIFILVLYVFLLFNLIFLLDS